MERNLKKKKKEKKIKIPEKILLEFPPREKKTNGGEEKNLEISINVLLPFVLFSILKRVICKWTRARGRIVDSVAHY